MNWQDPTKVMIDGMAIQKLIVEFNNQELIFQVGDMVDKIVRSGSDYYIYVRDNGMLHMWRKICNLPTIECYEVRDAPTVKSAS